jgi:hypothetical protein
VYTILLEMTSIFVATINGVSASLQRFFFAAGNGADGLADRDAIA